MYFIDGTSIYVYKIFLMELIFTFYVCCKVGGYFCFYIILINFSFC